MCVCGVLPSKNQSWRGSFLSVSDLEREIDCENVCASVHMNKFIGEFVMVKLAGRLEIALELVKRVLFLYEIYQVGTE